MGVLVGLGDGSWRLEVGGWGWSRATCARQWKREGWGELDKRKHFYSKKPSLTLGP
ncbi:MAG: hypothetical protein JXA77_00350 [Bacteroidales bacterium]|nr:hypothetical protein [Bacteroidales bacterium]